MPDHAAPTLEIAEPAPRPHDSIPPGTRLGRYLLGEAIGEGAPASSTPRTIPS